VRVIAYSNKISTLGDNGTEAVLTSSMTANRDTYFKTWSILDNLYISNGVDVLRKYDGTTFSTVTGTAIPVPRTAVVPVVDRLLAITTKGIERTSPRTDNVWSVDSSWATLRPQQPGLFTALHSYTIRGSDLIYSGALAFQERAYYLITGTDYGTDAAAGSASAGEDAAIQLLDPTVGTASPDSVCTVPGVGIFWFTTDLNVFWLPEGQLTGRYVGDKIQSTSNAVGIESTYSGAIKQVWMTYFDHMLMLGIPLNNAEYASTQWWLDMRQLRNNPDKGPVWYGPMTGQTVGRTWVENQQGDNKIMGGEGNSATGLYVYQLRVPARFTDAQGLTDTPISMTYQTNFKAFGTPSREKYVQGVHLDLSAFSGEATLDLLDLNDTLAVNIPINVVT
jgi:hypothetical protein